MSKKFSSLILCLATLVFLVPSLHAQAAYTASRNTRIQAGVGGLYLQPDYSEGSIKGISFWGDYDFSKYFGAEAMVNIGTIITPADFGENSYMIGPRFLYRRHRVTAFAKVLLGRATIINQIYNLSSSYNAYAFGGGLEYKLNRRINIRAVDVELQRWPDFEPHTLSPLAIKVGVSYVFF